MTDPIADMLTRIRNANQMRYEEVRVPASNIKEEIAKILKEEGYIVDYKIEKDDVQNTILINLKYDGKTRVITGLKRISKPGLRVYAKAAEMILETDHSMKTSFDNSNRLLELLIFS